MPDSYKALKTHERTWRMSGSTTIIDGYDTIAVLWKGGARTPRGRGLSICRAINERSAMENLEQVMYRVVYYLKNKMPGDYQENQLYKMSQQALTKLAQVRNPERKKPKTKHEKKSRSRSKARAV